jgi:hypothetical protein
MKREGTIRDFVIYGSVAAMVHTRPFHTKDIDIAIPVETVREYGEVLNRLASFGHFERQTVVIKGTPVDMFPADVSPVVRDALRSARRKLVEGKMVKVASPEHLLLEALRAFRYPDDHSRVMTLDAYVDRVKLRELFRRLDHDGQLKERYQELMHQAP